MNAMKHGLTASLRPLPGLEDGKTWDSHFEKTTAAFDPKGYLEEILVSRIAILAWRLGRVVRLENEVAIQRVLDTEDDAIRMCERNKRYRNLLLDEQFPLDEGESLSDLGDRLHDLRMGKTLLRTLRPPGGRKKVETEAAFVAIYSASDQVDVDLEDDNFLTIRGIKPTIEECTTWSTKKVCMVLEEISKSAQPSISLTDLIVMAIHDVQFEENNIEIKLGELEKQMQRILSQRILPDWETVTNISRYEAHLHRLFIQTLRELNEIRLSHIGNDADTEIELKWDD